jgi:hypothetical protein
VPDALAALVTRLLEKHPADRRQSADDVLRALDVVADAPRGGRVAGDGRPALAGARRSSRG